MSGLDAFDTPAHRRQMFSDTLSSIRNCAPNDFAPDLGMDLDQNFIRLFAKLAVVRSELKRDVEVADRIKALLEQALEAYRTGDQRGGARFITAAIDLHPTKLR